MLKAQNQAAAFHFGLDVWHQRLVSLNDHRLGLTLHQDNVTATLQGHLIEIFHVPGFRYHRHCIISLTIWA